VRDSHVGALLAWAVEPVASILVAGDILSSAIEKAHSIRDTKPVFGASRVPALYATAAIAWQAGAEHVGLADPIVKQESASQAKHGMDSSGIAHHFIRVIGNILQGASRRSAQRAGSTREDAEHAHRIWTQAALETFSGARQRAVGSIEAILAPLASAARTAAGLSLSSDLEGRDGSQGVTPKLVMPTGPHQLEVLFQRHLRQMESWRCRQLQAEAMSSATSIAERDSAL